MVTKIPDLLVPRPEFIELLRLLKPIQKTRREMKPYLMEVPQPLSGSLDEAGACLFLLPALPVPLASTQSVV